MFEDVPDVAVSFNDLSGSGSFARMILTARVRVSRPGGGLVTCGLWLGDQGPHLLESVEVLAPEDGSKSLSTYVSVMRGSYFVSLGQPQQLRLQVARDADAADGTCHVEGAALDVSIR
jgi:hypothetical protein